MNLHLICTVSARPRFPHSGIEIKMSYLTHFVELAHLNQMELCLFFDCNEMQNCASNMLGHLQAYWGEKSLRWDELHQGWQTWPASIALLIRFVSRHSERHASLKSTSTYIMSPRISLFHDICYLSLLILSHYILLIGLNVTSFEWNRFILFYHVPQIKLDLLYEWIVVKKFISVHISFTRWDT